MATRQEKIDNNRKYAWIQIENWLKVYYNKPIQVVVYEDKTIEKEFRYAKTVFKPNSPPEVYISTPLLQSGNKKNILFAACREAVRIGLIANGFNASDVSPEFRAELYKRGLPDYGGFPETGKFLHTYSCLKCKKVYALRTNKIPDSKSPCYNPKILTPCCEAMFHNAGKVFYKNDRLQEIGKELNLNPASLFEQEQFGNYDSPMG